VTKIQARARSTILLAVACFLLVAVSALAQSGGPYDLSWNTVDGGGYTFSVGGPYTLGGTIGQADTRLMLGGGYSLAGGFWGRGLVPLQFYLPLVLRDGP
jgi:hypothetical protein